MDNRRDFLKKAFLLSGSVGLSAGLPAAIRRAMAINPAAGSSFSDAEHVVILMQENRSFDHCFGTLKGVRGFRDPRAITLPDQNLVWMQTNKAGETYLPFRFDIRDTKATWMGDVPHSRHTQVDANHQGRYDRWLEAKRVSNEQYADMPLTLGYYTRQDIPFYYAMADAFTVCDQHFASAMTSTRPNRLFLWTGTIREQQNGQSPATVRNGLDFEEARWTTYPERLEENGISWKFYQNDIDAAGGLSDEERAWLSNFGCNPLEWFANYHVKCSPAYFKYLQEQSISLAKDISSLEVKLHALPPQDKQRVKIRAELIKLQQDLYKLNQELLAWSPDNYNMLSEKEKSLFHRAFTTNAADPDYHELINLSYEEDGVKRELAIPKGDILYQFRKDVETGQLPTVSWLAGPQNFSDHPSAPWYGSLYASEIMNILTQNPEVWKKTIFLITFDENDGYFDHVPPFVAPDPLKPETGKCSPGINTDVEFIRLENELKEGFDAEEAREGPIGLGYRVPLIIASPWSRGGQVCSELYDHTSVLQFLEVFLMKKFGKDVKETNISDWRRTVTGNLTAAFKTFDDKDLSGLALLKKDPFIETIYNAKFKKDLSDFKPLSPQEIASINQSPFSSPLLPQQEPGVRPSSALPYQLYADGQLSSDKQHVELSFAAGNEFFGKQSAGSPFNVYLPGKYAAQNGGFEYARSRSYAVVAGGSLSDSWPVNAFENGFYHLRVYGPNGFFREFAGNAVDPELKISCEYEQSAGLIKKPTGNLILRMVNPDAGRNYSVQIVDNAYKSKAIIQTVQAGDSGKPHKQILVLDLSKNYNWYDFSVRITGYDHFEKRYAGRVETGKEGSSDPAMG